MKQITPWILAGAMLAPLALLAADTKNMEAADGALTADERSELVAMLEATRDKVLRGAAALSDEAWTFKPGPDRWSVAQVVEHLMLAEGLFWERIDAAMAAEVDPEWATKTEGRLATLKQLIPDRSQRFQAPEPLQPGTEGPSMSRRELVERFTEGRDKSLAIVEKAKGTIKAQLVANENFGPMSAHHWLAFIALHNERHNQQIDEILADPKLPGRSAD